MANPVNDMEGVLILERGQKSVITVARNTIGMGKGQYRLLARNFRHGISLKDQKDPLCVRCDKTTIIANSVYPGPCPITP